ncbi:MAG: HNH endonuclease signature motif containing protein, partial [Armatimonadota bacterium]|nr:HNH endonuclease signature motif containing protein [Armatimonadota bacterium]
MTSAIPGWSNGTKMNGYTLVCKWVNGKQIFAYRHRLIWESHFGPIPPGYIVYFINEDRSDDSIDNLRCIYKPDFHRLFNAGMDTMICEYCGHIGIVNCLHGLCQSCYSYYKTTGNKRRPIRFPKTQEMCANGCNRPVRTKGMCASCYVIYRNKITGYKQH